MDVIIHSNIFEEILYNIKKINNEVTVSESLNISLSKSFLRKENLIKRRYIFFLNPIGGKGKSLQIWESVQSILSKLLNN